MRKKTCLLLIIWLCSTPLLRALTDSTGLNNPPEPTGQDNPAERAGQDNPLECTGQDNPLERTGLIVYSSAKMYRSLQELSEFHHPANWDHGLKLFAREQQEIVVDEKAIEIFAYFQREPYDFFQLYAGESLPKKVQSRFQGFLYELYAGRVETGESFAQANLDMGSRELSHRIRVFASYTRKDYPAVCQHLEEFLAFDPESFPALSLSGEISFAKMDWDKCIMDYSKVIASNNYYAYGYFMRGLAYAMVDSTKEAIGDLEKTLELFPENAIANNRLGLLYKDENQYEKAIPCFKKGMHMDPGNAGAATAIGSMYDAIGKSDSALYYYKLALDMNPENPEMNLYLANFHVRREEYSSAVFIYNKILTRDPDYVPALLSRGSAFMHQARTKEAMADFERVRQLEPDNADNLYWIGYNYMVLGENMKAREVMEEAVTLDSTIKNLLTNLAWVCYLLEDFDKSLAYSGKACEAGEVTLTTLFNHALYLLRTGKEEEAYALYQNILTDNPTADISGAAMDLQDLADQGILKKQARFILQKIMKLD